MRIVIVSRIFSPEPSAASFMLEAVARRFADGGHEVVVLTTTPPRGITSRDIPGVTVKRARVLRDSSGYVRGYLPYLSFDLPLAFRLLMARRADLYFVEPPPTTGAVVRVMTALLRRPYFYDAADIWSDAASMATSSTLVLRLLRTVEVFALSGARSVFTISIGFVDRLRELGVSTPIEVVGFGVDAEVFRFEPAAQTPSPYFVYAGTYSEWHGADIFVDAFARFSAGHPGYRLLFVGNGADRALLERRVADLGLSSVEFVDPMGGDRLSTLLASATASLASLKPGQGYDYAFTTKVYSSLAVGCPVIFAGVGPTAAFLDEAEPALSAGVAVPYAVEPVVAALTAAATHLVSQQTRQALSDWARTTFSLAGIAGRIVDTATDRARQ